MMDQASAFGPTGLSLLRLPKASHCPPDCRSEDEEQQRWQTNNRRLFHFMFVRRSCASGDINTEILCRRRFTLGTVPRSWIQR